MEDLADSSPLCDNGSLGTSTLERATLSKRPVSSNLPSNPPNSDRVSGSKREISNPGESSAFWALIGVMILLAAGNLSLTFFAMGVLRLGTGMESIEFHPLDKTTKFFGKTDLGNIQKKDGTIYSYLDAPFSILGDNSKILMSLRTKNEPPHIEVGPFKTEMKNVREFKVTDPSTGTEIFSTKYPNFGLPSGVKNLNVKKSITSRITSPTFSDLDIQSDTTIRLKGNEGLNLEGKKLTWAADQDIYLKTLNGSIVLDGGAGIFVEVNTLPLAGPVDLSKDRGQYKLCVCLPKGQLYRIPVPADNNNRGPDRQINCSSFSNPCMKSY